MNVPTYFMVAFGIVVAICVIMLLIEIAFDLYDDHLSSENWAINDYIDKAHAIWKHYSRWFMFILVLLAAMFLAIILGTYIVQGIMRVFL